MANKIPAKVQEIQDYCKNSIPRVKNISFSQLSMYLNCPKCWERSYVRKEALYEPSIHTCFGTAFHETLQNWLGVLYNSTVKAANEENLPEKLEENLRKCYMSERLKLGRDFTTSSVLGEFYQDGVAILDYIVKHRKAIFPSTKTTWLVGCEVPILVELQSGFYFKGFIDILTYEADRDIWKIWDIKTSTKGWKDEKTDFIKTSQILLYKEFLSKQFNIPLEKIEAEYFIVKRKVVEDAEYAAMRKRVQEFAPNDGPRIHKKVVNQINQFISEALGPDGEYLDKDYPKNPTVKNCRYCVFRETCPGSKAVL